MRVRLNFYLHSIAPQRKGTILWNCNTLHYQMTIDDLQRCQWERKRLLSLQEEVGSFSIEELMPLRRPQFGSTYCTAKYFEKP